MTSHERYDPNHAAGLHNAIARLLIPTNATQLMESPRDSDLIPEYEPSWFIAGAGLIAPEIALRFPNDPEPPPVRGYYLQVSRLITPTVSADVCTVTLQEVHTPEEMHALHKYKDGWQLFYKLRRTWDTRTSPEEQDPPEVKVHTCYQDGLSEQAFFGALNELLFNPLGDTETKDIRHRALCSLVDSVIARAREFAEGDAVERELGLTPPVEEQELACLRTIFDRMYEPSLPNDYLKRQT